MIEMMKHKRACTWRLKVGQRFMAYHIKDDWRFEPCERKGKVGT